MSSLPTSAAARESGSMPCFVALVSGPASLTIAAGRANTHRTSTNTMRIGAAARRIGVSFMHSSWVQGHHYHKHLNCCGAATTYCTHHNTNSLVMMAKESGKEKEEDVSVYKDTVNLPNTTFDQRANAVVREPQIQQFWEDSKVYHHLAEKNPGPKYVLHDGPPYANGALHMGHALNKVLKDFINRYQLLKGRKASFIPGWDCHGLPIELKVLQDKKYKGKSLDPVSLRAAAGQFAAETVESQKGQFRRLGVWADWDRPYLTMQREYEAAQIGVFGDMLLKGHIYRGKKPVHWSPSSRTALAEAELEYPEGHVSRSIYAGFKVLPTSEATNKDIESILKSSSNVLRLGVWTTTPWTLPANLAVAINPSLEYSVVLNPKTSSDSHKEYLIVAKDLVSSVAKKFGVEMDIVHTFKGDGLVGLQYEHPIENKVCKVVVGGDYITTESGTGLVHTAPGHGQEDYIVGMRENLGMVSPVDDKGNFTAEAAEGKFEGLSVLAEGNEACVRMIEEKGILLKEEPYNHKYPYDWRTKKPTIFRCTEQWFASVEGFREAALNAIKEVEWIPAMGERRIFNMVEGRSDWCISRQRSWGVPIPVFYEPETGESIMNDEIIRTIQKLFAQKGSNAWYEMEADDILPEKYRGRGLVKGKDTMDVWFDSGTSWAAVAASRESLAFPADLYLEGSDQHRGWFQSSLLTAVASKGVAPYKTVLTHGFVLDEKGTKMSKSIGNVIDPMDIINGGANKKAEPPYGADVLRLWVANVDYSGDVLVGPNIIKQVGETYRKLRNTLRYLIGNLDDFDPKTDIVAFDKLPDLDRYILRKLDAVCHEVENAYDSYSFIRAFQTIQRFAIVDLSNFYLDIAKDRLYISEKNELRRRTCQTAILWLLMDMTTMIAPILPHMAEDVWMSLPSKVKAEQPASVFLKGWLQADAPYRGSSMNEDGVGLSDADWDCIRGARDTVNRCLDQARTAKTLGASLDAKVRIYPVSENVKKALSALKTGTLGTSDLVDSLSCVFIASDVKLVDSQEAITKECKHSIVDLTSQEETGIMAGVDKSDGHKCERCWCYDVKVGSVAAHPTLCPRCAGVVAKMGFAEAPKPMSVAGSK